MNATRWSAAIGLVLLCAAGCGATTHPRYAPELGRRWPYCQRVLVIVGSLATDVKLIGTDDAVPSPPLGAALGQALARGACAALRGPAARVAASADDASLRPVADRMLIHARAGAARDPGYTTDRLQGLRGDPGLIPGEIGRGFDAVLVLGGRTRIETREAKLARWRDAAIVSTAGYPLFLASLAAPPLIPVAFAAIAGALVHSSDWTASPGGTYLAVALFDAGSGRLLYSNDWFLDEGLEPADGEAAARELLGPLLRVTDAPSGAIGERPAGWGS